MPEIHTRDYNPVPTGKRFHASPAFIRGVMGPVGSGKSVMCAMEVFARSIAQKPHNGVRRTRWAIVRNTRSELESTTIKTWQEWIPEEICSFKWSPHIVASLKFPLDDGTKVSGELHFLGLDKEKDVRHLRSLELTGVWLNEASEIPEGVFIMANVRTSRYPSKDQGGPTWAGIIMDTNPPTEGTWYHILAEERKPENCAFFRQPPALLPIPKKSASAPQEYIPNQGQGTYPHAENVENHTDGWNYWLRSIGVASEEWIRVFILGEYGSSMAGKKVYQDFYESRHVASGPLQVHRGMKLFCGWDFGVRDTAVVFCQLTPQGQLRVIDELWGEDVYLPQFIRNTFTPYYQQKYFGIPTVHVCDPAARQRSPTATDTCIQVMENHGINIELAPDNRFIPRRDAVELFLTSSIIEGQPAFLLSPNCRLLRAGFRGAYHYRAVRTSTGQAYRDEPEKTKESHPHDALQYVALMLRHTNPVTSAPFNPLISQQEKPIQLRKPKASGWT
jgi:hypothetical protein